MRERGRSAERRDRVLHAVLGEHHDVHVALDDDDAIRGADSVARLRQAVELAPLLEHRRLGRVQILRAVVSVDDTAAEADRDAALVENREDHAVPEPVIALALVLDYETDFNESLVALVL